MSEVRLVFNPVLVKSAVTRLHSKKQSMQTVTQGLSSDINRARASWASDTATEFFLQLDKQVGALEDMSEQLQECVKALDGIRDEYIALENAVKRVSNDAADQYR